MKENNLLRCVSILLAIGMIVSLGVYAELEKPKRLLERREHIAALLDSGNGYIYSDGSLVKSVNENSFTVNFGPIIQLHLVEKVPFKKGDNVAFKIRLDNGIGHLEEFHIWKPVSNLYIKAFLSLFPVVIVVFLFFREYRFNKRRCMFVACSR